MYSPCIERSNGTCADAIQRLPWVSKWGKIAEGQVEIAATHKNPRAGRMLADAFFTRELLVSIGGNVIAGLILAAVIAR